MQQWNKLSLFACFHASNAQQLKSITEDFFENNKTYTVLSLSNIHLLISNNKSLKKKLVCTGKHKIRTNSHISTVSGRRIP